MRRSKGHAQSVIHTGDLTVNLDRKTVEVSGARVNLTGKEYQILELLSLRKGNTLLGQLVAAGEIPLMVDGYNHTGYLLKSKGAPIELVFPEPYVTAKTPTGVWIGAP